MGAKEAMGTDFHEKLAVALFSGFPLDLGIVGWVRRPEGAEATHAQGEAGMAAVQAR